MLSKPKIILIVLFLPILAYILFELLLINSAYPNVKIGAVNIGGKNRTEIKKLLETELNNRQFRTLSFEIDNSKPLTITLNKNLLSYDLDKTIDKATSYGKKGPLQDQLKQKISILTGVTLEPVYTFDEFTFDTLLADAVRSYENEVVETKILFSNNQLILSPSKPGLKANRDQLLSQVKDYINLKTNDIRYKVTLTTTQPKTTRENSRQALEQAERAISKQITLYSSEIPDKTWTLDTPDLYNFLEFTFDDQTQTPKVTIANYKVAEYTAQIKPLIYKAPKEAKFETAGDKVIVFETSENGRDLDTEKLTQQLTAATFGSGLSSRIEIPIKTLTPAVTQTAVNQYGIKELIAQGSSLFTGSTENRFHNIEVAAEKLNGTLIKPDQTFSLYATIGDIEKQTGFVDSAIIKNGRTVTGVGGGVCQVSTTVFRAALNAGLPITERVPHSYRVKYYELDSPPGFDASIYFPNQDFKFKNNTGNNIILQTKIDKENNKLTVNIFGVKDGRSVQIDAPQISNQTPPPPELRQNDPTINKGLIRQIEFAAEGATVALNRTVTKDGKTLEQNSFISHYRPWQAVLLIGTKPN